MRRITTFVFISILGCGGGSIANPLTNPQSGPPAGNPDGHCAIPGDATPADSSHPDQVVGTGTAASCTGAAFVAAVAQGGVITFACGPDPVTITLDETAKIFNDASDDVVIDGAGLVTLSGAGNVRILYLNTCDEAQHWTTSHCDNQDTPRLTVQNITFVDGSATGLPQSDGGGGAIFASGGRLKIVNSRFFHNVCDASGSDVGGGAVRAFQQSNGLPLYVVNSTFGGSEELGNSGANGGGISSIGVSYTVINSTFSFNRALGMGASSGNGGNGGGIYNDGNTYTLDVCGTVMHDNDALEGGGAIFFVSNDHTGSLIIRDSMLSNNPSHGFETMPGIYMEAAPGNPQISGSTIE